MRHVNRISEEDLANFTRTLYRKGADGLMRYWRCWTEGDTVVTEYGVTGTEAPQFSRVVCTPKNVGRKNETTAAAQAVSEARALFKNRLERKYSLTPEAATEPVFLPMKAKVYADYAKRVEWDRGVIVQPKLDGVRCMATLKNNEVILQSSGGKPWKIPHLLTGLTEVFKAPEVKDWVLDGEIYRHGLACEDIVSLCKRPREETRSLSLHVFDAFQPDKPLPQEARLAFLWECIAPLLGNHELPFEIVFNATVYSEADALALQEAFVSQGYEGAIIRDPGAEYIPGTYVPTVLKIKTFDDAEFLVTGAREGVGKFEGCAIFECLDFLTGETFDCTPKGTLEKKREYLANLDAYIGKQLKVKYFGRTIKNLPRFPVGLGFRDEGV